MASEELPIPQEALEAVRRVLASSGGYRDEDGAAFIPRDAEAAIRAAFEAMGMKVEHDESEPGVLTYRLESDWMPVDNKEGEG